MFYQLATLAVPAGHTADALRAIEPVVNTPDLLGCWTSILGAEPRIYVLSRVSSQADHTHIKADARQNTGLFSVADKVDTISLDTYTSLPCLPEITTGQFGRYYEIRTYELYPNGALNAALDGWSSVIQARLQFAPITAVMHSVNGLTPRLVHIYPYKSLAERREIRDKAIATGLWPPKGGARRNQVMRTEIAIPAAFSPLN